jgi:hypothetical protein
MNDGARRVNEEESNGETGKELNVARSFGHSSFIIDSLFVIGDSLLSRTPQCL